MHRIYQARMIILFLLPLWVPAQSPDSATIAPAVAGHPPSAVADTAAVRDAAADDSLPAAQSPDSAGQAPAAGGDSFFNPFAGETAPKKDTADYSANPFHDPAMHRSGIMTGIGSQKPLLDILLDISLGYSLSRFSIESPFYSTRGQGDFLFNIGIILPIKKLFYFEIAFNNMQLRYSIDDSTADQMGSYFTTRAEESMNYCSLPLQAGAKRAFGICRPYVYASCAPAYLTSSKQLVKRKSHSLFLPDSATYAISSVEDKETTGIRERFQVFLGVGAGVEIDYGYGAVYLDCSARLALRETGYRDFPPSKTTSRLIVFPVSLGLRFYL